MATKNTKRHEKGPRVRVSVLLCFCGFSRFLWPFVGEGSVMSKIICLLASVWISAVAPTLQAAEAKRPNILWLIAEDFGPHLGCDGTKEVWTPNLDKLA